MGEVTLARSADIVGSLVAKSLVQSVDDTIFEWIDATASDRAHEHPDVAEIWEAMEPLCESRNGRPSMEFPHFQPLA